MIKHYKKRISILFLLCFVVFVVQGQNNRVLTFAVSSGNFERHNSPVSTSIEGTKINSTNAQSYQLVELAAEGEQPVQFQIEENNIHWILSGETPTGSQRVYELRRRKTSSQHHTDEVNASRTDGAILFHQFGQNILQYQIEEMNEPDGSSPLYRRGGFIHPLWSPKGEVLTRIQPPDHFHHVGIWNPWTQTTFEGRNLDFWNLYKGEGTVKVASTPIVETGPVFGSFLSRHEHVDLTAPHPSGSKVAVHEDWEVKIWQSTSKNSPRIIDFRSTMNCATDSSFTINAYRYQGFSIRATEKWDDETARLLTSEGKDKSNGNATRAKWCDINGVSTFGTSGILFMSHPNNHNFPEKLRIWPTGANGGKENVYINFNPAQEQDWVLHPGKSYVLNYRMLVYDGQMEKEAMEAHWQDYTHPVEVEVIINHENTRGKKILIYTKNGEGYVHKNIPSSIIALKEIAKKQGLIVDESDDPAVMTEENLKQYDALIFSNTNNETFDTDQQRLAFQRYILAGGGFVGIHSACGSERSWPWFSNLLGGKFKRHPPLQQFDIEIINPAHPSTQHLPDIWQWEDECYYMDHLNPRSNILLTARMSSVKDEKKGEYPDKIFGKHFPLSWSIESGNGRVWYTALGHKKEYYSDPNFVKHLEGGILWVLDQVGKKDYSKANNTLRIE